MSPEPASKSLFNRADYSPPPPPPKPKQQWGKGLIILALVLLYMIVSQSRGEKSKPTSSIPSSNAATASQARNQPSLSQGSPQSKERRDKMDIWMAVKNDVEREGRYFVTADIDSLGDIKRFDYILSYKIHPRTTNQIYEDMEAVFVLTAQQLEEHGYNHNQDGIHLRARAFMPQGSTQNAKGITFNMLRFGKGHLDLNAGRIVYDENWWEWTDGE